VSHEDVIRRLREKAAPFVDAADALAKLAERVSDQDAYIARLHADNQRLRWRHPLSIPEWNDLLNEQKEAIVAAVRPYADCDWDGDAAAAMWRALRREVQDVEPKGGET
jgi:hypothetical protein